MNEVEDVINPLKEIFKNVVEKNSRWLKIKDKYGCPLHVECMSCGGEMPKMYRYCPHCGARMENYDEKW